MANLKQLELAHLMYPNDNQDRLTGPGYLNPVEPNAWVDGWLDYSGATKANTNIADLLDPKRSRFAPYLPSAEVYKCPADFSYVVIGGKRHFRIRSMSMSQAMGGPGGWLPGGHQGHHRHRRHADTDEQPGVQGLAIGAGRGLRGSAKKRGGGNHRQNRNHRICCRLLRPHHQPV